jgi:hypothetical protein
LINRIGCCAVMVGYPDAGGTSRQRLRGRNVVIAAEKTRTSRQGNRSFDTDAIVRRWQTFTGKEAICASAAATFTERDAAVNAHNNNPRRRERANEQE